MSIRYEHMAKAVEVRRRQLEQAKASKAMLDALINVESFAGRALLAPYRQPTGLELQAMPPTVVRPFFQSWGIIGRPPW